ncbi:MAG: PAS domain-containing protein [Kofleriaceae bacterium]
MSLRITPTMLHCIDNRGRIEEVSEQWLATLGYRYDEVIGRPSTDFLSEDSARYARQVVLPAFFESGACNVEYEMRRKDGVLIPVRLTGIAVRNDQGVFVRSIAVIEDLTERRALEQKMFAAQKLESLGMLAGNVAHDFNNLLASVVGNAQLGLRHAGHLAPASDALNRIMTAAARAADLCRQLLAYSGRGQFEISHVELDALVAEMVQVLEVNVGRQVALVTELDSASDTIHVDVTQIRQIVMNLVINAAESLADREGTVRIATRALVLDAATIAATAHPDIVPGRYVCLEVSDDGSGMPPEILAQIFDPFFDQADRARPRARGGPWHRAWAPRHARRSQRAGARHAIRDLPACVGAGRRADDRASPASASTLERRTILVIDDDELLRRTLRGQLEGAGYEVLLASTGREDRARPQHEHHRVPDRRHDARPERSRGRGADPPRAAGRARGVDEWLQPRRAAAAAPAAVPAQAIQRARLAARARFVITARRVDLASR